jgi:hypothetical protein
VIVRPIRLGLLCAALLPGLVACSLLSIRTPDKPLPQRDVNARMLTREFAGKVAARVEVAADEIAAQATQSSVEVDSLRWKLGASRAAFNAAMQMAPLMSLLDTWAFCEQMRQFFDGGAGATVFGAQTQKARDVSNELAADAVQLARGLLSDAELGQYQSFVERYSREHPLTDLGFVRASVVDEWVEETNSQATLIDTVGTVSQSMSDVSDRMRIIGQNAPSQAMWEARLAMREAGLSRDDLEKAFAHADQSLERLSRLAESSPEQLRAGIQDVREAMLDVSKNLRVTLFDLMRTMHDEREALAMNIQQERKALLTEFDAQRTALAANVANVADRAITTGGVQARALIRELVVYGILLFLVVLGLPFAAGYYIGRLRSTREDTHP